MTVWRSRPAFRFCILPTQTSEFSRPGVFGVRQHHGHELEQLFLFRTRLVIDGSHLLAAHQCCRVYDSHLPTDEAHHRQHSDALDAEYSQHQVYD